MSAGQNAKKQVDCLPYRWFKPLQGAICRAKCKSCWTACLPITCGLIKNWWITAGKVSVASNGMKKYPLVRLPREGILLYPHAAIIQ